MDTIWYRRLAGAAAGLVNGLFGGGGGMVLLPLLRRGGSLEERKAYATCVAIIFPICLVSAAAYLLRQPLDWGALLPYLVGGFLGGLVGSVSYGRVPLLWLRRLFGAFLLYGAVRYLL